MSLLCVRTAFAGNLGLYVYYSPQSESESDIIPSSTNYVLSVRSPSALPASAFPVTVTLRLTADNYPLGDAATALSYISFSSTTLTFTSPGQTLPVTVYLNFPATALSSTIPGGSYGYSIFTDGWPAGMGVVDNGAKIGASVALTPPPTDSVPTVVISDPVDQLVINASYTDLPLTVPLAFTTTSPDANTITGITADVDGTPIALDAGNTLNTTSVSAIGSMQISTSGSHTVTAWATSAGGSASDVATFTINVAYPAPTVTINTPTPGSTYTYRLGGSPVDVALSFTGTTTSGSITQLFATLDDTHPLELTTANLNQLSATGTADIFFTDTGVGPHHIHVTAGDQFGQVVSADTNFTINVVGPQPAVNITTPTPNLVFMIPSGATTAAVPFSFTTTVQNGFNVDTVSATLGSTALPLSTTGLGSPSATSTGTVSLPVGSYTLAATGGSAGITVNASVSFTVKAATLPPSVVITSPPVGYTLAIVPGTTATVPLTFTGTSNNPGGVITTLSATLDGASVPVASSTIGQTNATGTATLSVTASGTHHIVVTATDAAGNATATRDFTITYFTPHQISGTVFFDLDGNGVQNGADFGLAFVTVQLLSSSNQVLQSTVTNAAGSYTFPGVYPGTYTVKSTSYPGLVATTPTSQSITMASANVVAAPIGYKLNFCALQSMKANAYSMGFWKTNLSKALSGKTNGVQVSAATLTKYTLALSQFALSPFDGLTMKQAVSVMSSTSSKPVDLLAKQLLPAEYNYENGAYINGNPALTFAFVAWGEAVMQNSKNFSSGYLTWAAGWFEAYNTSEGGYVSGPGSSGGSGGGSCSGGDDDGSGGCSGGGGDD